MVTITSDNISKTLIMALQADSLLLKPPGKPSIIVRHYDDYLLWPSTTLLIFSEMLLTVSYSWNPLFGHGASVKKTGTHTSYFVSLNLEGPFVGFFFHWINIFFGFFFTHSHAPLVPSECSIFSSFPYSILCLSLVTPHQCRSLGLVFVFVFVLTDWDLWA